MCGAEAAVKARAMEVDSSEEEETLVRTIFLPAQERRGSEASGGAV